MEATLEPPRRPYRHRRSRETTIGAESTEMSVASPKEDEEVDKNLVKDLNDIKEKILGIENDLTSRRQKITEKRVQVKEDVKLLFDDLHELLERKECDLNAEIDNECVRLDGEIKDEIENLHDIRDPVEEMIDKHKYGAGTVTNEMLRNLHSSTRSKMPSSDIVDHVGCIPYVDINFSCQNIMEELKYGEISTSESVDRVNETDVDEASGTVNANQELEHDRYEEVCEQALNSDSYGAIRDNNEESDGEYRSDSNEELGFSDGATGIASAPPLAMLEDEEEEADPPPYWQAIGLTGPTEETESVTAPPLNVHSYHDPAPQYSEFDSNPRIGRNNVLEVWHSFPVRKQHDMRKPLFVALSWDNQRICVADRNNKKVKFFSRTGDPLTEMYISSGEIHDVAFLEGHGGEARYIITLPRERTLLLVAVFHDNSTKLVRKIVLNRTGSYYTSICRGPKEQTLVGAMTNMGNAYYTIGKPRVEMIDFSGNIRQVYKGAMSFVDFEYPRSVQVFHDTVIVADWKLSLVAIFLSDGSQIGEYSGTATSPLLNPLDLAVDTFGNVMIVDGENPSIHVISPEGLPIEVLKVPRGGAERSKPKLVAFDRHSRDRLAVMRSTGDMAIFSFRDGYKIVRPGELDINPQSPVSVPTDETLPYVEGMLPTTIASIGRVRGRPSGPNFFL